MDTSDLSPRPKVNGIDIHHHFLPPVFVDGLTRSGHPDAAKVAALAWSPEKSLGMIEETGIETAMLSLSLPGVSFPMAADPATLARQCNEFAASMIADHPGRFGAFACLPMLDIEAAMGEITYALDVLKFDGVQLLSNVRGKYLGDADFDPVLAELNRRKAIVFLHPNHPPGHGYNDFVEFPHDVSRAMASLTESGAVERYPHIQYILAYGGGTIPFIAARITVVGMDVLGSFLKTMISYLRRARTMRRMRYDLTAATDRYALQALIGHAKPARILMGSNFPWTPVGAFVRQQEALRTYSAFDLADIEAIEHGNAFKLFSSVHSRGIMALEV